ncbi:peptidoglycan editing factor PgeF [Patescibacteria group bacterium]|nr:peptidoglycan editing factor PgeF [Patescibacteria group bacterium]
MSDIIIPEIFASKTEIICGFSTKQLGNQRIDTNNKIEVINNQKKFASLLGINFKQIVLGDLIHGKNICIVENNNQVVKNCDALITNKKGIFLMVTIADCLPIFIYDSKNSICGVMHSGWKSLTKGIIPNFFDELSKLNSDINNVKVAIGPGIGKCHFEVKDDVLEQIDAKYQIKKNDINYIDLKSYAYDQIVSTGVSKNNIEISDECTYCQNDKYFSYRRDKPRQVESMAAIIGIK